MRPSSIVLLMLLGGCRGCAKDQSGEDTGECDDLYYVDISVQDALPIACERATTIGLDLADDNPGCVNDAEQFTYPYQWRCTAFFNSICCTIMPRRWNKELRGSMEAEAVRCFTEAYCSVENPDCGDLGVCE